MFLNPFTGFAQNAQNATLKKEIILKNNALGGSSQVIYDSSYVPHIFTKHDSDLYFLQGYVLAKDRLWQMEMQSRSGMGELSEIVGPIALENDRLMRRLGIYEAAQTLLKQFEEDGTMSVVNRYTQGVNAYIESLSDKDLPIEFKLMGFKPRKYEPIHTAILLKIMAMRLTAMEADIENTNFVNTFGKALFDELYPNFYKYQQPICSEIQKINVTPNLNKNEVQFITKNCFSKRVLEHFDRSLGSNNWAVSASKSASGNAMLANDPHLKIHLPAIWYEMHLVSDEQNVYGATMPGAPGIVIGFNNNIAWGVTNAGRDVRNWYDIQFKKGSKSQIIVDSG
jgi:penicillin amidase